MHNSSYNSSQTSLPTAGSSQADAVFSKSMMFSGSNSSYDKIEEVLARNRYINVMEELEKINNKHETIAAEISSQKNSIEQIQKSCNNIQLSIARLQNLIVTQFADPKASKSELGKRMHFGIEPSLDADYALDTITISNDAEFERAFEVNANILTNVGSEVVNNEPLQRKESAADGLFCEENEDKDESSVTLEEYYLRKKPLVHVDYQIPKPLKSIGRADGSYQSMQKSN